MFVLPFQLSGLSDTTLITMPLLDAVVGVAHAAFEVISRVTVAPFGILVGV